MVNRYFDASQLSYLVTRRSVTSILYFINNTSIERYSKRQGRVKITTYGSKMVAERISVDYLVALRYNLRMLDVQALGLSILFGDNLSMITRVSLTLAYYC